MVARCRHPPRRDTFVGLHGFTRPMTVVSIGPGMPVTTITTPKTGWQCKAPTLRPDSSDNNPALLRSPPKHHEHKPR